MVKYLGIVGEAKQDSRKKRVHIRNIRKRKHYCYLFVLPHGTFPEWLSSV